MINTQKINSRYQQLCHYIHVRRIKEALDVLREMISDAGSGDFFVQQEHLETTYEQMLRYTLEGVEDPQREVIFAKLQESLLELADKVKAALHMKFSGWHTLTLKRELENEQKLTGHAVIEGLDDLKFSVELDEIINDHKTTPQSGDLKRRGLIMDVFKHLWLTDLYGEAENSLVSSLITCKDFTWYEQSLEVGAILLSALRYFDEEKIHRMIDIAEVEDIQVSGRALVGLILLLQKYNDRLYLYPSILERLDLIKETLELDRVLEQVAIQLIRTEDTLELGKKLHEDIIPEISKLKPKLEDKLKMDDLEDEGELGEKNPDWENVFKESDELYKKVDEFMRLQMEGADVYMTTFSQLKNFPFFNELTNWIMPFYEENPDLFSLQEQKSDDFDPDLFVEGLKKMPFLCNSDKYSFIFNVQYLPNDQKRMLTSAFSAEMESLSEMLSEEEMMDDRFNRRLVFVQFIQDLYRFFKLSPFKNEFSDIFNGEMNLVNTYFFKKLIDDEKITQNIGEFYFEKGRYDAALEIFKTLLSKDPQNVELMEKVGYSHQKMDQYQEAIGYYEQIGLHDKSASWIISNMGYCYRKLEDYESALKVYLHALEQKPDDIRTETLIGFCNLKLERYETALKHYFKIDYLQPGSSSIIRPIAWSYFALGSYEKAEKYFNQVFDRIPDYYDYINYGHLKWVSGDRKAAAENYILSTNYEKLNFKELQRIMEDDRAILTEKGISTEEFYLMMDFLRYRMKG